MVNINSLGWRKLIEAYPWFSGRGNYPIPAYSEYTPPPREGKRPNGGMHYSLFADEDLYGWNVSTVEETYVPQPGLTNP